MDKDSTITSLSDTQQHDGKTFTPRQRAWAAWCKETREGYDKPIWVDVADNPDTALIQLAFDAGWNRALDNGA